MTTEQALNRINELKAKHTKSPEQYDIEHKQQIQMLKDKRDEVLKSLEG
jgi:hypothetical protein